MRLVASTNSRQPDRRDVRGRVTLRFCRIGLDENATFAAATQSQSRAIVANVKDWVRSSEVARGGSLIRLGFLPSHSVTVLFHPASMMWPVIKARSARRAAPNE